MIDSPVKYDKIFDAQEHFRILLDAMAHPGTIYSFSEKDLAIGPEIPQGIYFIAFALLNADVRFAFLGSQMEEAIAYIHQTTSSQVGKPEEVEFLFMPGTGDPSILHAVKTGNLSYPEEGASLVVYLESIHEVPTESALEIHLKGPGIESEQILFLKGIHISFFEILKEINAEFPLGIDTYFVDEKNQLIAIPRSNHFTFKNL